MVFTDKPGPPHRTFVLVHGIGMGRIVFEGIGDTLAPHGRVLAVDLPGFGDSPEPGTSMPLEETAKIVAAFIRAECCGPVVLVGHSMGTQIVAEVAVTNPELVSTLVLIAPTVNQHERTAFKQALRMMQDLVGTGPKVLLLGLWQYFKTSPLWYLRKLQFMLRHRLELVCPSIPVPTLVMRGENDPVCPIDWVSEVTAAIPVGEMREIPGHGHEAVINNPEPAASMILDFALRDAQAS